MKSGKWKVVSRFSVSSVMVVDFLVVVAAADFDVSGIRLKVNQLGPFSEPGMKFIFNQCISRLFFCQW